MGSLFSSLNCGNPPCCAVGKLPELLVEFFDSQILARVGNKLGGLVRIVARTEGRSRGRYARICIQVDLAKPLILRVRIGNHRQVVAYEGVSTICFQCGLAGHRQNNCPLLQTVTTNPSPTEEKLTAIG